MKNYKIRFTFLIILVIPGFLLFQGCIDEEKFNMDTLSTDVDINPGVAAPVAHGKYQISDFLDERTDTLIFDEDADNLIKLAFSEDSLYSMNFEDFYETPTIQDVEESFSLGTVGIPNQTVSTSVTLQKIADNSNNSELEAALASDDNVIIDAFKIKNAGSPDFEAAGDFVSVTCESGTMEISLTNNTNFPVNVDIVVRNKGGDPLFSQDSVISFDSVPRGNTKPKTRDMKDETMKEDMTAVLKKFGSDGTDGDFVAVNGTDNIEVVADAKDLEVRSGEVKPDNVDREFSNDTVIDFSSGQTDAELTKGGLSSGELNLTINSELDMEMSLTIKMPRIFENGNTSNPVEKEYTISEGRTEKTINLKDALIHFSPNPDNPKKFNEIPISYSASNSQTSENISFHKNDQLSVTSALENYEIDFVWGYMGSDTIAVDKNEMDIGFGDFLGNVQGGLTLTDPKFTMNIENTDIGIPVNLDFDITGSKNNGQKVVPLEYDFPEIKTPQNIGDTATTIMKLNKKTTNSSIVDLMAMPPDKIKYSGDAYINKGENKVYDNFVTSDASINVGFSTDIPLKIKTDSLKMTDTLDAEFSQNVDELDSANLIIDYTNQLPFKVGLELIPYNSANNKNYQAISPEDNVFLKAGKTNDAGVVTAEYMTEGSTTFKIDQETIADVSDADSFIVKLRFATYEGKAAELQSDYQIKLDIKLNGSGSMSL